MPTARLLALLAALYNLTKDAVAATLKDGKSKIAITGGQVVKVSKDANVNATTEVLTKQWTDWIDYWSVDFNFEDKREIIPSQREEAPDGYEEVWTGDYIFENEWQSFRTRKDRTIELTTALHTYPATGRYKIAVKVVDILGNDTMKVKEVGV